MNDPTYTICKVLTYALNPKVNSGQSLIENAFDLKEFLVGFNVDKNDRQAYFDIVALNPSIPISKALECAQKRLINDTSLSDRTDWKPYDIMKLSKFGNTF